MNNVEIKNQFDLLLKQLSTERSFDIAEKIAIKLADLLNIKTKDRFLANISRVDAELTRFQLAPGFARQAAAYELPHEDNKPFDLKLFWIKKASKTNLSWIIGLTPNFEDAESNDYKNIGIDFVVPETCDSIIILLSNRFKVRALELKDHITPTQLEIFSQWIKLPEIEIVDQKELKKTLHTKLWESFNFEPINRKFYLELVEHFSILVHHLEKDLGRKPSVMFTTRLIGRLLFIWFLKKKNLINKNIDYFAVPNPENQTNYYENQLEKLFFEVLNTNELERTNGDKLTPYLNGGLFDKSITDFFGDPKLTFPNGYFNQLFTTLNKYNFTVDESSPEFQHVAIDPEMLGRIFESLLAEQIDENTGNSKKKATGAFYTPREIVSYMCEQSLIEYLKTKVNDTPDRDRRIDELLKLPETIFRDQDQNKRDKWRKNLGKDNVLNALDEILILDPAVGSGAFPMGMLHLLVKVYSRLDPKFEKDISELKRDILSRSLYGVDIEQTAIEITRLRAWLSIIVDIPEGEKVEPLPNLEFKFVCANTLIPLDNNKQATFFTDHNLKDKLITIRDEYFKTSSKIKKEKLQKEYLKLTQTASFFDNKKTTQLKSYRPFDISSSAEFYDQELMHGVKAFDIVIGNPPYVSTKGVDLKSKKDLEDNFGFADDLYSHFYFKGLEICKNQGVLSYITSKTFWTIQTKKNVRELLLKNNFVDIYDTANPFESVMVDTCVVLVQKNSNQLEKINFLIGNKIVLSNGKKEVDYSNPIKQRVEKVIYEKAVNKVIFDPSPENITIYHKYNDVVSDLMKKWWLMISTSKNIIKYGSQLIEYRDSLRAGDVTLLGLITDGGQGLATANNGKYVGVLSTSKEAIKTREARVNKFFVFTIDKKITEYGSSKEAVRLFLNKLTEKEVRKLFDSLKEKHGRDIFGTGFLYRIIDPSEIKDVNLMSDNDKENGLSGDKTFVPYDKGDKDGNRWYLRTPYYIDWSKENINWLKSDSRARFQGYQFYFRAGFCWSDIHTVLIKTRRKEQSVHDVKSMSMFSFTPKCTDKYLVCLLNSTFISNYDFTFINTTSSFQINDARQLPIIIPNKEQLNDFEDLFDRAYAVKVSQFDGKITNSIADQKLKEIQRELDEKVSTLYDITPRELKNI
jgi:hypothetical protein